MKFFCPPQDEVMLALEAFPASLLEVDAEALEPVEVEEDCWVDWEFEDGIVSALEFLVTLLRS